MSSHAIQPTNATSLPMETHSFSGIQKLSQPENSCSLNRSIL